MDDHASALGDTDDSFGYAKVDQYNARAVERIASAFRGILEEIGEDPTREGLAKTPERFAKAMQFLTHGHDLDPAEILRSAMFREEYRQMVIVRDIEIYSLCEHHVLPFFGKAHVAYIPNGYIVGLSKIARVVDAFARRLQVQERLTIQVADWLDEHLQPRGVGVVLEAEHLCMSLRGVQAAGAKTVTSALRGLVRDDPRTRQEFLSLITTK